MIQAKLTPEETSEADALLEALLVRFDDLELDYPYSRYVTRMRNENDLDLLRCMDRLMTTSNGDEFFSIERAKNIVQKALNREAAPYLTREMIDAESRVRKVLNRSKAFDYIYPLDAIYAFVFENVTRTDEIIYLIEHRKIMSVEKLAAMISGLNIADHTLPLRDGLI